ncbi:MAG: hypothetical protein ACTHOR_17890 [Devosia sp.]
MKDRFPRTAGEFLEHGRSVVVRCHCGRGLPPVALRPENVVQRLGGEFDLYGGFGELRRAFPCEACEKPTDITFHDFNAEHFRGSVMPHHTVQLIALQRLSLASAIIEFAT